MEYKDVLMDQLREFARFLAHLTRLSDQGKSNELLEMASQYIQKRYGLSANPNPNEINLLLTNKSLSDKELDELIQLFEILYHTKPEISDFRESLSTLFNYKSAHSTTYDHRLQLKIKALYDLR
jgi:hypothetical protein